MHPFLNMAVRAARRAGDVIVRNVHRSGDYAVTQKGRRDYVTEIDQKAEAAVIDVLARAYPDHAYLAEESGQSGDSDHVWIIDPLDGTTNFMHQYPQFAVSIALAIKGQVEHAVIYDPMRDELFTGSRGAGAQMNNRRLRVSNVEKIEAALIATGFPVREQARLDEYLAGFRSVLEATSGIRRGGAAALDLAHVACGRLDGFWELGLKPWDIAAGAMLVQEAGGMVSEPDGADDFEKSGNILCGNPRIHTALRGLLHQA
ncbi:MAG: inositol monophosphatase [Gammaproteobacteria bacterium]|nr:inositol monophosphatase [Gammaproteobacteria bacterium]NNM01612.1 inositol monophosphatase [Gammaproteobacteria bacterium]